MGGLLLAIGGAILLLPVVADLAFCWIFGKPLSCCAVFPGASTADQAAAGGGGATFSANHDKTLANLNCRRVQVDEAWAFCYAKQKNVATAKAAPAGAGDIWTGVGLDTDTKVVPSWYVSARDSEAAMEFMDDLVPRLAHRVQPTSDGHKPYLEAVEGAFGGDIEGAGGLGGHSVRAPRAPYVVGV